MQLLQQVLQDIQRGENMDFYIIAVVSIALSILNILGIAPQAWTAPLTLGVLALLAFAMLGNRHRLEMILQRITVMREIFTYEFPEDLHNDMEKSEDLLILGSSLGRTLQLHYPLFEEKLRAGKIIKALLINPDSPACEMAALRNYPPMELEVQRTRIRASLKILQELKAKTSGMLEIRVLDNTFVYGGIIPNLSQPNCVLYLWYHHYRMRTRRKPKTILRPANGDLYEFYKNEIMSMWDNAMPWPVPLEKNVYKEDNIQQSLEP